MKPIIVGVSISKFTFTKFDQLIQNSTKATIEGAIPGKSIYVYVYGSSGSYSVIAEDSYTLNFDVVRSTPLTNILPSLGTGSLTELEVTVPLTQDLKKLNDARMFGPVLFTKIKVVDSAKVPSSNLWPLCVLMNVPVILGVTKDQVQGVTPVDVYADLLKNNLATLVKGTTPGGQLRTSVEQPPPGMYIYGCNFLNPKVKPAEIPTVDKLLYDHQKYPRKVCSVEFDIPIGPLTKTFQFELQEIGVSLPTMADLQNSTNYLRNAFRMAFGVQIVNDHGNGEGSNIWQWPMALPMPVIAVRGPDKRKGYGNGNFIGNENCPNDHGEVRWYFGNPDYEQKRPLDKYLPGVIDELQKIPKLPYNKLSQVWSFIADTVKDKKTIVLPQELVDILNSIRQAGELCEVDKSWPIPWADDTVCFQPPYLTCYKDALGHVYNPESGDADDGIPPWTSFNDLPGSWVCPSCKQGKDKFVEDPDAKCYKEMGFVIVWRGDIPSLPLPINLFEYVKELAKRLWRPVFGNGIPDYDIPIPIPVGEVIQLGVERLEDVANELVAVTNKTDGLNVRFAFLSGTLDLTNFHTSNNSQSGLSTAFATDISSFASDFEPGKTGIASKALKFTYNPQAEDFTLQLNVNISNTVTLFGKVVTIPDPGMNFPIGPRLKFHPQPIDFPTMAVFFTEPNFKGSALVALPSGTPLFEGSGITIDANAPGDFNLKRVDIINQLSKVNDILKIVDLFGGVPNLDKIIGVISEICAIGRSVIDTHGIIKNVSDLVIQNGGLFNLGRQDFNDKISSVAVFGPPHHWTGTTIRCWENSLRRKPNLGWCLKLQIPDDKFIFTIPDFTSILRGNFDAATLDSRAGTNTFLNFDNTVTGIEFVQE